MFARYASERRCRSPGFALDGDKWDGLYAAVSRAGENLVYGRFVDQKKAPAKKKFKGVRLEK